MALTLFGVAARIILVSSLVTAAVPLAAVGILVVLQALTVCRAFKGLLRTGSAIDRRGSGGGSRERLSPEDLETLPRFNFRKIEDTRESVLTNCAICLEYFRIGDSCKLLPPCGHSFHTLCVDSWLPVSPICPLCRTPVVVAAAAAADRRSTASSAV